jgi:hypothetical protein
MAAQAAPYAALTGGATHRITTARTVLHDHYQECPHGQQGDCVMVTAVPMSEPVGGDWDFARVGDCRANTVQNAALDFVLETVYWDAGTARLLPRLLKGRTRGPVFVTHRRRGPGKVVSARDICPETGLARLSYGTSTLRCAGPERAGIRTSTAIPP